MANLTAFEKNILRLVKEIPVGKVVTYKTLALALNRPRASRAVGNALHKNPELFKTPCHRVIKSSGLLGDYVLGPQKKVELLKREGVIVRRGRVINLKDFLHSFNHQ